MPQQRAERPSFTFNKGLMTDASPLTFPPDFSLDELNFELMLDGTRRRRRGLEAETAAFITQAQAADAPVRTFKWRAVGDNPDLNFHIWQIGSTLYFYNDVPEPSSSPRNFTLDLVGLAVEGYESDVVELEVDMAFGRGHALLVGKYIDPVYIVYDPIEDDLDVFEVNIRERDFQGVEDNLDNTTKPAVASDEYIYNMVNEGWAYGDVLQYQEDQGNYPSKNMVYWQAFRRATVPGFAEVDGTRQFSSDKLVAELFQDAPAPRGHFIQDPFNTGTSLIVQTETIKNYGPMSTTDDPNYWTPWKPDPAYGFNLPAYSGASTATNLITITFQNPHFLNVGETFTLIPEANGRIGSYTGDGNRFWNISAPAGSNFVVEEVVSTTQVKFYHTLTNDGPGYRPGWIGASWPIVYAYVGGAVIELDGRIIDERPTATAFFAGRAWYAGIQNPTLSSALYFSQIVEVDAQYGKCYQVADPTDENISDLIATDGGVLRIPQMGQVYKLLPFSSSLLVFASNGVWEVGPGSSGYFTATSYSVRKVSGAQCVNATSVADAEGIPVFWAKSGIFAIVQDTNTGFLTAQSLSAQKIDTMYALLGDDVRRTATADYDDKNKRVMWVYQDGDVSRGLVFDVRFGSFTLWEFGTDVRDIFTVSDYASSAPTSLRFIVQYGGTPSHQVAIPTSLDFEDYGASTSAYLVTGYDTAGNVSKRKFAPVISVFMKRTEQMLDDEVINPSSLTMQARWDFSDNSVAGKWGTAQQVYRHLRPFTLAGTEPDGDVPDGIPLVITRNKVRGRGRAMHLKFEAGATNDAHILGWATNFTILTET